MKVENWYNERQEKCPKCGQAEGADPAPLRTLHEQPAQAPERIAEIRARIEGWRANCAEECGDSDIVLIFEAHAADDVAFLLSQVDALTATLAHLTQERDELQTNREFSIQGIDALKRRAEQAEATLARVKALPRIETYDTAPMHEYVSAEALDAALVAVDPRVSSSTEKANG